MKEINNETRDMYFAETVLRLREAGFEPQPQMEQYHDHVTQPDTHYYGEVIDYACGENQRMGRELIAVAPKEWIANAPTSLHVRASVGGELILSQMLVSKGLQPGNDAATVLQNYTGSPDRVWMAERLLRNGMEVDPDNYYAFDVCVKNSAVECAKLLLEHGTDLDSYLEWADSHHAIRDEETIGELRDHWQSLHTQEQAEQQLGGMTL